MERGESNVTREYRMQDHGRRQEWELFEGRPGDFLSRPLRYERLVKEGTTLTTTTTTTGGFTQRRERREVGHWREGRLVVDKVTEDHYERKPWGWAKTKELADPDGQALETAYGFQDGEERFPGDHRVQWVTHPDGNWEWFGYDAKGRQNRIVRPTGNTPRPNALPDAGPGYRVLQREFDGPGYRVKTTESLDGVVERITFKDWRDHPPHPVEGEWIERTSVAYHPEAVADDPSNEVTIVVRDGMTNEVIRRETPDGRVVLHELMTQNDERTRITKHYLPNGDQRSETLVVTHRSGTVIERRKLDMASGVTVQHEKVAVLDDRYRPVFTVNELTGRASARAYACCGPSLEITEEGFATI